MDKNLQRTSAGHVPGTLQIHMDLSREHVASSSRPKLTLLRYIIEFITAPIRTPDIWYRDRALINTESKTSKYSITHGARPGLISKKIFAFPPAPIQRADTSEDPCLWWSSVSGEFGNYPCDQEGLTLTIVIRSLSSWGWPGCRTRKFPKSCVVSNSSDTNNGWLGR